MSDIQHIDTYYSELSKLERSARSARKQAYIAWNKYRMCPSPDHARTALEADMQMTVAYQRAAHFQYHQGTAIARVGE